MNNTQNQKQRHKEILLRTFKDFDLLCKEYNLTYYMAYGTLIGAIRHQGLIPWDDDIDVYMPIEDYYRFLSLKNKLTIPYRICDIEEDGYFKPFAKFCDNNTTIYQGMDLPVVYGVYIDIFPLYEGTEADYNKYHPLFFRYSWRYEMGMRYWSFSDCARAFRDGGLKSLCGRIRYLFDYKLLRRYYLHKWKEIEKICRSSKGDCYISYAGPYRKEVFPKEWFSSMLEKKYENQMCMVPSGYHEYLSHIYGNYMQLPPPMSVAA